MPSADARAPDGGLRASGSAIQAPRLLASEPQITNLPRVELADGPSIATPAAAPSNEEARQPASIRPREAVASDTTPYDRIAALSAVAPREPLVGREPRASSMSALEIASSWFAMARDYVELYWRQIGLIASLLFTAGLLFWRLGERSRHADQELVLTVKARLDEIEAAEQPVFEAEPDAFEHDVDELPAEPAIQMASVAQADSFAADAPVEQPVIRPVRQHATLREAIEAMKADMARAKSAVQA